MNRRDFVAFLGGLAASWPLAARAQQAPKLRRIGILMNGTADAEAPQSYVAALLQGLREFGWVEGQNLRSDVRWNGGDAELSRIYAAQLIGQMPDVIVASSSGPATPFYTPDSVLARRFGRATDPFPPLVVPGIEMVVPVAVIKHHFEHPIGVFKSTAFHVRGAKARIAVVA